MKILKQAFVLLNSVALGLSLFSLCRLINYIQESNEFQLLTTNIYNELIDIGFYASAVFHIATIIGFISLKYFMVYISNKRKFSFYILFLFLTYLYFGYGIPLLINLTF